MTLLSPVDSPPRWDLTPFLICLTPPQLLSAGPIPHSFDVTQHPTNPNTTVYGRVYFLCHKNDFPLIQSELAQWLIFVIGLGTVLECLELIPESVNDFVGQNFLNSRMQVRTRWHMKTSDYLFNCIAVFTSKLVSNINPNRLHYAQCLSSNWILMLNALLAFVPMPTYLTCKWHGCITWCLCFIIAVFIIRTITNRRSIFKNYLIFIIIGAVINVGSQNNVSLFNQVPVSI